jgi:hypothetical protein
MTDSGRLFWLVVGLVLGAGLVGLYLGAGRTVQAATSDRYEDYILCSGAVAITPRALTDGVWLLDYRGGKLLGTVIDRNAGKVVGWAQVDLVNEFGIPARQNAHFMMVTGQISQSQAALYVAETTTGKFGVYTMGPRNDGQSGVVINRHDMSSFHATPTP